MINKFRIIYGRTSIRMDHPAEYSVVYRQDIPSNESLRDRSDYEQVILHDRLKKQCQE